MWCSTTRCCVENACLPAWWGVHPGRIHSHSVGHLCVASQPCLIHFPHVAYTLQNAQKHFNLCFHLCLSQEISKTVILQLYIIWGCGLIYHLVIVMYLTGKLLSMGIGASNTRVNVTVTILPWATFVTLNYCNCISWYFDVHVYNISQKNLNFVTYSNLLEGLKPSSFFRYWGFCH